MNGKRVWRQDIIKMKGRLTPYSYDAQLKTLHKMWKQAKTFEERLMIMSIAESVKAAVRHNLDCREI